MTRNTRTLLGTKLLTAALFGAGGCHLIIGLDEFVDAPPPAEGCQSAADCPAGEHETATCEAGVCELACEEGYADCTEAPGCETATAADRANCGGCGVSCAAFCEAGECNDPVDIAAGPTSACAILQDGSVWCWGRLPGPIAEGEVTPMPMRIDLPGPAVQVASSSGGLDAATGEYTGNLCAVLTDGTVWCWGSNQSGQLGLGHIQPVPEPQNVGLADIRQVATGMNSACAIDTNDQLYCWGANAIGLVGNGTDVAALNPDLIMSSVAQVSVGPLHACATMLDGSLACWGSNAYGCLGLGASAPAEMLSPTVVGNYDQVQEVACGALHTCARIGGATYCWGYNANGQLGLGDTTDRDTPQMLNIAASDSLANGQYHTGMIIDGDVYTWGDNAFRQLGTADAFDASSPQRIDVMGAQKLALGGTFSCVLMEDEAVLCWGGNGAGQLGDGTTEDRAMPRPVVWP